MMRVIWSLAFTMGSEVLIDDLLLHEAGWIWKYRSRSYIICDLKPEEYSMWGFSPITSQVHYIKLYHV